MSISPKNEASQNNTAKRRDYISWDEYFMGIAMLSAMRSKDPNSQVGACIVRDNKILSLGYNGMPIGCNDDIMPWGREGNELETKYMYVCHSELNAILNAGKDLHGASVSYTSTTSTGMQTTMSLRGTCSEFPGLRPRNTNRPPAIFR